MTYGTITWEGTKFTLLEPMYEWAKIRIEVEDEKGVKIIHRVIRYHPYACDLYFIYKNNYFFKMEFLGAENESY